MANTKFIELLNDLLKATKEGRLHWSDTESDTRFKIDLQAAVVEVEEGEYDGESGDDYSYIVTIKNKAGKIVEVEIFDQHMNKSYQSLAGQLYELARKDSLKVEQLIDTMIDVIREKK